jgi:hypothetical protein
MLDRLARSTFDLFGIVKRIVDAKAQFRSLEEPWADTGASTGHFDARGTRLLGGRAARSNPPLDRRRPKPRQGPRKAHGPTPFPDCGAAERGHQTAPQGATLGELARSYNVGISTIRRVAPTVRGLAPARCALLPESARVGCSRESPVEFTMPRVNPWRLRCRNKDWPAPRRPALSSGVGAG